MIVIALRQRNFILLWLGTLISQTGDWLLIIGLPIYVYMLTGSALATSLMLIAGYVPNILFGSLAGVLVDRWDRRRSLIVCNLLLALGILPLLAVHSKEGLWIIYVVQFFESSVEQIVLPAQNALLPDLVNEEVLVSANALNTVSANTARLAGAALGGLLVGFIGLSGVALLDAGSFLFVSVMIGFMRSQTQLQPSSQIKVAASVSKAFQHFMYEWKEGLQLILHESALTVLLITFAITGLGEGVFSVLLIVFVNKVLFSGAIVYGSLLSIQAIGSLVGGLVIGNRGNHISPTRLFSICLLFFGFIDLLIVDLPLFFHNLFIVFLLFLLVGIPSTGVIIGLNASLQVLVKNTLRGRTFATLQAMRSLMTLIAMWLAGILGDHLGPVFVLNTQGGMYMVAGLLALITLRKKWGNTSKDLK